MSEVYGVLVEIVRKLNRVGWHTQDCNVHPRQAWSIWMDLDFTEVPGGKCDCGADQLVLRVNKLLKELAPGQLELAL